KLLVKASGWKYFPSRPLRANTGMNEISMMSTEKKMGRPTVRHARITTSRVSPVTFLSPNLSFSWWVAFSTMTMAWSTRMAMEILDLLLDSLGDGEGVLPVPHQDDAADHLVAVLLEDAAAELCAHLDRGDVLDVDGRACVLPDHRVVEVVQDPLLDVLAALG